MKHSLIYMFLLILMISACKREVYTGFRGSDVVITKQRDIDGEGNIPKIQRIGYANTTENVSKNFTFKTTNFVSKPDFQIVKKDTLIKETDGSSGINLKIEKPETKTQKAINYNKMGNVSGVLGVSSLTLIFLAIVGGSAIASPLLLISISTAIFGFILGTKSFNKVPKNERLMPIIGILIGSIYLVHIIVGLLFLIIMSILWGKGGD